MYRGRLGDSWGRLGASWGRLGGFLRRLVGVQGASGVVAYSELPANSELLFFLMIFRDFSKFRGCTSLAQIVEKSIWSAPERILVLLGRLLGTFWMLSGGPKRSQEGSKTVQYAFLEAGRASFFR